MAQQSDPTEPSLPELQQKVEQYTAFVRDVLRPDLQAALESEQETMQEIKDYQSLHQHLLELHNQNQKSPPTLLVNLGHGKVYCNATMEQRRAGTTTAVADENNHSNLTTTTTTTQTATNSMMVFVHVGLGFHTELSLEEALKFCDQRVAFLTADVLIKCKQPKTTQIKDHILSSENILDELCREIKRRQVQARRK